MISVIRIKCPGRDLLGAGSLSTPNALNDALPVTIKVEYPLIEGTVFSCQSRLAGHRAPEGRGGYRPSS